MQTAEAKVASTEMLLDVHDPEYIKALHTSPTMVARVVELGILQFMPNFLLQRMLVQKMQCHTGGTMLAVAMAATRAWAINIGGGLHHASFNAGMGWCPFSDITLAVRKIREATQGAVQRVMIIDSDAHQGNGHERDKIHFDDQDLFIVDLFNSGTLRMPCWNACRVVTLIVLERLPCWNALNFMWPVCQPFRIAATVLCISQALVIYCSLHASQATVCFCHAVARWVCLHLPTPVLCADQFITLQSIVHVTLKRIYFNVLRN